MFKEITVVSLFNALGDDLKLSLWAGDNYIDQAFSHNRFDSDSATLVGHFNLIHSNQSQVLGHTELNYLQSLKGANLDLVYEKLFEQNTVAIFVAEGEQPPAEMRDYSESHHIPIFTSPLSSNELINHLQYYLSHALSEKMTLHGVFMEVISIGVLLIGESGLGKSELALELITRGHRLIPDDAPEFTRIAPDIIRGACPPLLENLLEVRGLGLLDIREMYGDSAIKFSKYLRLIISLHAWDPKSQSEDRLSSPKQVQDILGIEIPVISIPVAPGRNLAVLVEAAVRNHLIASKGYDVADQFIQLQRQAIEDQNP